MGFGTGEEVTLLLSPSQAGVRGTHTIVWRSLRACGGVNGAGCDGCDAVCSWRKCTCRTWEDNGKRTPCAPWPLASCP